MSTVVVNELVAGIGKKAIVTDVSFTARSNTMTAVVGINGAGKSTLLRAIAGITRPLAGSVTVDDVDTVALSPRRRANIMAFIGQEESPPADLTVEEMVALGRLPHRALWDIGGAKDKEILDEALALVGMTELRDRPCGQLSGGQRRRALLARGFAQQTPILLADEPTNHLDVHHQHHLLEVMQRSGRTVIATIHDVDLAYAYFDQVIVVHGSTVHAHGCPRDVLTAQMMRTCFDVEAVAVSHPECSVDHLIVDRL